MSLGTLVLRYAAFAGLAVLANLATQRGVIAWAGPQAGFVPALLAGTGVGLVVKYLLDKRWIFADASRGLRAHGRRFTLYTLAGVLTTAIFWGFETVFWLTWRTETMREAGAVIGLAIGYVVKYRLDRRYVFTEAGGAR